MNFLKALILGIIQGATEFFPISSSGHLKIAKKILAIPDGEHLLYFDLLCHAGTLCALIVYLRREILSVLQSKRQMTLFTLALIPLIPGYFLLRPVRLALSDPAYLGYFLILTGFFLWIASKKESIKEARLRKWPDVLWIGCMQTMALIPGISRSGATIATARMRGWHWLEGAKFSFLLAIPTILGGEILESVRLLKGTSEATNALSFSCYAAGFFASFAVGLIAVRAVFWIYEKSKVRFLSWYCFAVGIAAWVIFHE